MSELDDDPEWREIRRKIAWTYVWEAVGQLMVWLSIIGFLTFLAVHK